MSSAKSSNGQILVILLVAVVLLLGGGFLVYQYSREARQTPVNQPAPLSNEVLESDLDSVNQDLTALDRELGSLDATFADKQGDLSE